MGKQITYTINLDAEISTLTDKLNQVKTTMKSALESGEAPGLSKIIAKLTDQLDHLREKTATSLGSEAEFSRIEKDLSAIKGKFGSLETELERIVALTSSDKFNLLPPEQKKFITDAQKALNAYSSTIDGAEKKTAALTKAEQELAKAQKERDKTAAELASTKGKKTTAEAARGGLSVKMAAATGTTNLDAAKKKAEELSKAAATAAQEVSRLEALYQKAGKGIIRPNKQKINGEEVDLKAAREQAAILQAQADTADQAQRAYANNEATINSLNKTISRNTVELNAQEAAVHAAQQNVDQLTTEWQNLSAQSKTKGLQDLADQARALGINIDGIDLTNADNAFAQLSTRINELVNNAFQQLDNSIATSQATISDFSEIVDTATEKTKQSSVAFAEQNEKLKEVNGFTTRIKQFIGLSGAALLARKALQSAFNTIKELDKQMTDMAVVTDLGVNDYWEQLPEYTKRANDLGVAIKDVYEASTLYYQQGLKANEVTAVTTSTLKMARIAGLSAEDATNKMTAALRGFNMEVNETNADRVADVYSKLAAITASNVQEISSAMTKTASIAASAGMKFETTAAFLSQVIETTRESAETAGTALKTVIARFQELKKDPAEIGEVDGEIIDANKIETALRSVGVALRDSEGQFRSLDNVFLELSAKWDSLDVNTQRYIATIAAGSRQQSRFIAMMSDYARTQDLVTAANTAAGASNEQFEKTLESLDAKLAKLKNAWNQFTLSIANSAVIKGAVDVATGILTVLDNIIAAFDKVHLGGVAAIGMILLALKGGEVALKAFQAGLLKTGSVFGGFGAIGRAAIDGIRKSWQSLILLNKTKITLKVNTKDAQVALANYNKATKTLTASQSLLNAQQNNGVMSEASLTKLRQISAQAQQQQNAAIAEYGIAMGLTNTQATEALALQGLGISEAYAAAAAVGGLTAQKILELQATMIANGLDDEEIANRSEKIALLFAEKGAQQMNNAEVSKGILVRLSEAATNLLVKLGLGGLVGAKSADTAATGAETRATISQTVANVGLLATMLPILIVIGLLIVAIGLLVLGIMAIVALFKQLKANSPAGKLESAAKATEEAGKAADIAADKYQKLNDSLDELSGKYNALQDLTKGTKEWNDAVQEINNSVLDLIEQYPELSTFIQNKNGVLTLDTESKDVQDIISKYQKSNARAQSALMAAKINQNEKQANYNYSKLGNDIKAGNQIAETFKLADGILRSLSPSMLKNPVFAGMAIGRTVKQYKTSQELDYQVTDEIAKQIASGSITITENAEGELVANAEQIAKDLETALNIDPSLAKAYAKGLADNVEELREYGNSLNTLNEQTKAYYSTMAAEAFSMVEAGKYTTEQLSQMQAIGTAEFMKTANDAANKAIEDQYGNLSKDERDQLEQELASTGGYIYEDGKLYAVDDEGGKGDKVNLTPEELKEQIAAMRATNAVTEAMEKLPKALSNVDQSLRNLGYSANEASKTTAAFNRSLLGSEGSELTQEDLAALDEQALKDIYLNDSTWGDIYASQEEFMAAMLKITNLATQAFADAEQELRDNNISVKLDKSLNSGAVKGFSDKLVQIASLSGVDAANAMGAEINSLLSTVAEEDRNKLASQLNAIDWTNATALEKLPETLQEIGINIPSATLDDFIIKTKDAANALHEVNFEKLTEQLQKVNKVIKDIAKAEVTRTFDSSTYESIIGADASLAKDFAMDLEGNYIYLGESMEALTGVLNKASSILLNEQKTKLQNSIDAAKIVEMVNGGTFTTGNVVDIKNSNQWTETEAREYAKIIRDYAVGENIDLTGVTSYLSANTKDKSIEKMDIDDLREDIGKLSEALQFRVDNENKLTGSLVQAGILDWLKTSSYNATQAALTQSARLTSGDELNIDEMAALQIARKAVATQAELAGVSEADLKILRSYNAQLEEGERLHQTNTDEYKELTKESNAFMKQISAWSTYNRLHKELTQIVSDENDLVKAYQEATSEAEKTRLAQAMGERFGIQITKDNQQVIAGLMGEMLQGSEDAFENIINWAAANVGLSTNLFIETAGKTADEITALYGENAETYMAFLQKMDDLSYGHWDELTNTFIWNTDLMKNAAKEVVEEIEKWENPYTWLYNMNEALERQSRIREKLENRFQRSLAKTNISAEDINNYVNGTVESLETSITASSNKSANALTELSAIYNGAPKELSKYVAYNNGQIAVDYAGAEAAFGDNADMGEVFEKFVGELEAARDTLQESTDELEGYYDELTELAKLGQEQYDDLRDRLVEALSADRQAQIDLLSTINDSITEAASKLTDKMQEQIDDQRQARENEKTEQELADNYTKLAYLRQDTSGANAQKILELEKSIKEAEEGYQDSLVDQTLQELQDANEKAAEQRSLQIDLLQQQLDFWNEYDARQAAELQLNADLKSGQPLSKTLTGTLIGNNEGVQGLSETERKDWLTDLDDDGKLAQVVNDKKLAQKLDTLNTTLETQIGNSIANEQTVFGEHSIINSANKVSIDDASIVGKINDLQAAWTDAITTKPTNPPSAKTIAEQIQTTFKDKPLKVTWEDDKTPDSDDDKGGQGGSDVPKDQGVMSPNGDSIKVQGYGNGIFGLGRNRATNDIDVTIDGTTYDLLLGKVATNKYAIAQLNAAANYTTEKGRLGVYDKALYMQDDTGAWHLMTDDNTKGEAAKAAEALLKHFATGGLADYTGPAWLDGTASHPELVLNSKDTAHFIELKDILSDILRGGLTTIHNVGDEQNGQTTNFDVDINVDNISNDYDVDQMAERVKVIIESQAQYRNVNNL